MEAERGAAAGERLKAVRARCRKQLDKLAALLEGDSTSLLEELAHLQGWTDWEIRHARSEKAQRNGIFRERIFLEKVLED